MAAVELGELIPNLVAMVSVPGKPLYQGVAEADWIQYLLNGFYLAQLEGMLGGWESDEDGVVTPVGGGDATLSRELQQIAVIYAGIDIVRNELRQLKSVFKAKAGPVSYETQQHASVLKAVLDSLMGQKATVLDRLSDTGYQGAAYVVNNVLERDANLNAALLNWVDY